MSPPDYTTFHCQVLHADGTCFTETATNYEQAITSAKKTLRIAHRFMDSVLHLNNAEWLPGLKLTCSSVTEWDTKMKNDYNNLLECYKLSADHHSEFDKFKPDLQKEIMIEFGKQLDSFSVKKSSIVNSVPEELTLLLEVINDWYEKATASLERQPTDQEEEGKSL